MANTSVPSQQKRKKMKAMGGRTEMETEIQLKIKEIEDEIKKRRNITVEDLEDRRLVEYRRVDTGSGHKVLTEALLEESIQDKIKKIEARIKDRREKIKNRQKIKIYNYEK